MFYDIITSREFTRVRIFIFYAALITAIAGGCLFALELPHWRLVLSIAGALYIIHQLMKSYEPLHEILDWTLVYPELQGMSEEVEEESKEKMQLKLDYLSKQLDLAKEYLEQMDKAGK